MIIQSKLDVAVLFLAIILVGALGGLITTMISDWRYSDLNTPTNPELTKGKKSNNQIKKEKPEKEFVMKKERPKKKKPKTNKEVDAGTILKALASQSTGASNVRYVDGEKQWTGGLDFLEGVKYNLSEELASE